MSPESITPLIIEYRYWILIPLSLLEGPVVAFAAGALAAGGYFNPFMLEIFFIVRDLVTDILYYALGVFAGRGKIVRRLLHKIGVTADHLEKARSLWDRHPLRTMFVGKLAYGIAPSFFVVAGMTRMPLPKFLGYNALVASFQYGVCLLLGYFLGSTFGTSLATALGNAQLVIGVLLLALVIFYVVRFYFRKLFLREEEAAE